METLRIGGREVGPGRPAFVIAEAGINHNGSLDLARRLVDAAAEAGCDAVKFQKRAVRALLSREAYDAPYSGRNSYGATYGEHRERLELKPENYVALRDHARERGIHFMASVWDPLSASLVDSLGVPAHKIGSPDLTNLPLCAQVARFGRPVILSTGMSEMWELDAAVRVILDANPQLVLLHCVSVYPAPFGDLRLGCIPMMRERYGVPVGYSGHEPGWHAVLAAVALGACVVEKHITLDRSMKGGDHGFSLEPGELRTMMREIRETEAALVGSEKFLLPDEIPARRKLGKSLTTKVRVPKGTVLTPDMLTVKGPATGLSPVLFNHLLGKRASHDLAPDTVIRKEDVA
ncbi:MAG: N-acetylneuraminate synthase family protein [Planctomycetes bacterium]|nr:N-acetylneuraminate synthase family protein [Planctomycetota bacterium]